MFIVTVVLHYNLRINSLLLIHHISGKLNLLNVLTVHQKSLLKSSFQNLNKFRIQYFKVFVASKLCMRDDLKLKLLNFVFIVLDSSNSHTYSSYVKNLNVTIISS